MRFFVITNKICPIKIFIQQQENALTRAVKPRSFSFTDEISRGDFFVQHFFFVAFVWTSFSLSRGVDKKTLYRLHRECEWDFFFYDNDSCICCFVKVIAETSRSLKVHASVIISYKRRRSDSKVRFCKILPRESFGFVTQNPMIFSFFFYHSQPRKSRD